MLRVEASCGTYYGYTLHYRKGTQPCVDCRDARNAYRRRVYAPKPPRPIVFPVGGACRERVGTNQGYGRHRSHKDPPCLECKAAHSKHVSAKLGTPSARQRKAAYDAAYRVRRKPEILTNKRLYKQFRRARAEKNGIIPFTQAQFTARMSMFVGCWMCSSDAVTDADHVKPIAAGGGHMLANLRPACRPCNMSKSYKWPFLRRLTPRRLNLP